MKRREFMTLIGSAVVGGAAAGAAWPPAAGAQQPGSLDDQLRKSMAAGFPRPQATISGSCG
jgi:hypothetical protein